jgi:adenosylcobyric acid synthase
VIPGSKRVVDDLAWLRERGFERAISSKKHTVVAICGGYEMMFEKVLDPYNVESPNRETQGFARFKGDVVFEKEKIVKKESYNLFDCTVEGYEIHNGVAKEIAKKKQNVYGTFVHGLFDSDEFRNKLFSEINKNYKGYNFQKYKAESIDEFAKHIDEHIDMDFIEKELYE